MDLEAAVPENPQGGGIIKNALPEGRNRRVLRDIGNLVPAPGGIEGKPQNPTIRPVTRSFGAQLLANAQAAATEKDNCYCKKTLAEIANGVLKKDPIVKPMSDEVIVISSDESGSSRSDRKVVRSNGVMKKDSVVKPKSEEVIAISSSEPGSSRSGRKVRSKKPKKSLTSILSARSKAACGFDKKPKDPTVDIDAADVDNELAVVEYIEDMYNYYKLTEKGGQVDDYMDEQLEINSKMRAILVDWLIEVHRKFELMPESLYLTVNIMDRLLSIQTVPRRELQLVGIGAMLIACKYEEIWAPEVSDFIAISDNAYTREQVLLMEKAILGKLEWYLTVPTPYVFLVRYIKASIPADKEMEYMTYFFAELGLVNYSTIIKYSSSKLSAAAVYTARCTLNRSPSWTEMLKHYTGYSKDELMECAKMLVSFHMEGGWVKSKAVFRKYSNPERGAVALFPPTRSFLHLPG